MKRLLPVVFLILLVGVFFKPFFANGMLPIPSDTIVGLYNPFRDLYASQYPRGVPFKNFLITDPVRQEYPWRNLAIEEEKKLSLPLWNPYSMLGTPLLANFQSAALYPLNALFFVLPFSFAWSLLVFLQPVFGAVFLYLYLRNLRISIGASILGSIAFAFCGFATSWLEWNTLFHVLLWVPLVLLAKDKLLEKWSIGWTIVFFFAEVAAFFAGHLQTLFYALIITNLYLFLKVYLKAKKQKDSLLIAYNKIYLPFLLVGVAMFVVTAIQWVPTLQFILQSARDVDLSPFQNPGWFLPWQHLVQFLVPDFFGNPTTLNYWGVWNYAELAGFIGIIPLIFSLSAIFHRRDKKTYFWTGLVILSFIFALPTPLATLPFTLNIPFISTAQPTRLIAVIDFSLAILAALGLDIVIKNKKALILPVVFVGVCFTGIWGYVLYFFKLTPNVLIANILIAKHNLLFPTAIFAITVVVLLFWLITEKITKKSYVVMFATILILITVVDVFRFSEKFLPFTNKEYLFPQTKVLSYLQQHVGISRVMETDAKILPPNFSVMYHIQSVDGYDPLYIRRYGEFIAALSRNKADIHTPFGFNRIITPQNIDNPLINLLGVKYILSLTDIKNSSLTKVSQEGETRVYENTRVLPRSFFVENVNVVKNKQKVLQNMYQTGFNPLTTAYIEKQPESSVTSLGIGTVVVKNYQPNMITLTTQNEKPGFLVLTDVYYPTWHAYVDGKETQIFVTDYTFRGITVLAGNHTVVFSDSLF